MRVSFSTLGCKVNQYETEVLAKYFAENGFTIVPDDKPGSDVYVVGSCTVTAEGDRKTRQLVRRFRRENPGAVIILSGCFPQAFPDKAIEIPEADIITGTRNRAALPSLVRQFMQDKERIIEIIPHEIGEKLEPCKATDFGLRTRAFVKIEDGCDNWCSYCIVPAARGPVRSKSPEELLDEFRQLSESKYEEIVLTGINLSNYGRDWGGHLSDAVLLAASLPGIKRIRLGSVEPDLLTPEEIIRIAKGAGGKFCPHFHLPLQSGCDRTLERMNRHYKTDLFRNVVKQIRETFPDSSITTDMMVGFVGETEEDHQQSLAFAKEMQFAKIHAFSYSERPGTVAFELPNHVDGLTKKHRCAELMSLSNSLRNDAFQRMIGREEEVLFESRGKKGLTGYTPNYTPVTIYDEHILPGCIQKIKITGINMEGDTCEGIIIPK